jgi:hypothetical protein
MTNEDFSTRDGAFDTPQTRLLISEVKKGIFKSFSLPKANAHVLQMAGKYSLIIYPSN